MILILIINMQDIKTKILILVSDATFSERVEIAFRDDKFECAVAHEEESARDILKQQQIDVIIMESVFESFLGEKSLKNTPIVLLATKSFDVRDNQKMFAAVLDYSAQAADIRKTVLGILKS